MRKSVKRNEKWVCRRPFAEVTNHYRPVKMPPSRYWCRMYVGRSGSIPPRSWELHAVYRVIEMSSRGVNRSASRLRLRVGIICQGAQHIDTNDLFLLSPPRSKWNYVEREADSIRYPRTRSWYDHWFQWLVNDAMMYRGASPGPTDDPNKLVHFLSLFIWSREQVKMSRVESAASEW